MKTRKSEITRTAQIRAACRHLRDLLRPRDAAPGTPLPPYKIITDDCTLIVFRVNETPALSPSAAQHIAPAKAPRRRPSALRYFCFLLSAFPIFLPACSIPHPAKGGYASTRPSAAGVEQALSQSDSPAAVSRQDQQSVKVRTYTVPAGSRVDCVLPVLPSAGHNPAPQASPKPGSFSGLPSFVLSAPMPVSERDELKAQTELGPAQKDIAREMGAKLASLRGIVWVGLGLFLFGLASLFYAPLRAMIGSVTTSVAMAAAGIALMVLPSLIVGNELLILAVVSALASAWFLAHRHGHLRGQLAAAELGATTRSPATPKPYRLAPRVDVDPPPGRALIPKH